MSVSLVIEISDCAREDKRLALERALHSRTFARSEQLRAFLQFVCEAEMRGAGADLTEYVIGVEVLGRPEGYSPAEDSSVRTRAYELRQKLEKLYSTELQAEAIQIVVPKGAYTPHYVKPSTLPHADSLTEVTPAAKPVPADTGIARQPRVAWLWMLAAALVGAAVTFAGLRSLTHKPAGVDPIVTEAWGPLAKPGADVLLCAATPLHLVVGPGGTKPTGVPTTPLRRKPIRCFASTGRWNREPSWAYLYRQCAGCGNYECRGGCSQHPQGRWGLATRFYPERVATISALRGRNAILFGAPVDSEAITRTLRRLH